ncbi:MAG: DCC1-like thiol-disulfide oxidoreductase family protein [Planctomycetaceae bacterium]
MLLRLDRAGRVTAVPYQDPGVPERFGIPRAECEEAAWAVEPSGRRHRGAGAVNAAVAWALGLALPLHLYELPGVRQIQDAVYAWVARNRHRLASLEACEAGDGA